MWEKKDLDSTKSTLTSGIIMCWERIDKREGSEQGRVYWDQKWYEHTVQRVSTESRKYTEGNVHRQNEKQYMMAMLCHSYTLDCSTRHWRFCLICFLPQGSSQHFNIYIINLNWSGHSGVFWLLAHLPSQLLLHVVEVLAVFVPQAQQFNHVLCWIAELKEKSGSTILRTQRSSALITCYSTLTKVFLNWSSADPWFSSLCCPPTFCPPLLFSTLTISETTRIEMSL